MLMCVGGVVFRHTAPNIHETDASGETAFAEKPIVGGPVALEHVGENVGTLNLRGRLFPQKFGGLNALATLHSLRASGMPQIVARGDGVPLGFYVIVRVTERASYLDRNGVGRVVEFDLELKKDEVPSAGGFFSLMRGFM